MHARLTSSLTGLADFTTRRTSLLALGGAGLATLAGHVPATEARKNKNKARKKAKKQCEKQGNACREFIAQLCAQRRPLGGLRDACLDRGNACCSSIEQCDGGEYFDCLFDHLEDLAPPEV